MVKIGQMDISYVEQVGPEYLLRGAQYTLEMINFTMFIAEEAEQAATSGCSLAIQSGSLKLAQRMADEVLGAGNNKIWEIIVMYALGFSPAWHAFYCYLFMTNHYISWIRGDLAAAWAKEGVYTREDIDNYPGTAALWSEQNNIDLLSPYSIDNEIKRLEEITGENIEYFSKIIEEMNE